MSDLAPVPHTERVTLSAGLLDAGVFSIDATLLEDDIRMAAPAPRPTRGATADLLLSRVGTHVIEVPADGDVDPNGNVNPDGTPGTNIRANFGNVRVEPQPKGPHIIAHEPSGTIPEPVHEVVVAFNKPIDAETFTPDDVNVSIGVLDVHVPVTAVEPIDDQTFLIAFGGPDAEMEYFVWIGPNIEDSAGNLMDQDRDGIGGEADDVYNAGFTVATSDAPRIVATDPAPGSTSQIVSSVAATFDQPMDPESVNAHTFWVAPAYWINPDGTVGGNTDPNGNGPGDGNGMPPFDPSLRIPGEVWYDERTQSAIFTPFLERLPEGRYYVVAEPAIRDVDGESLDGEWRGEFPSGDGMPGGRFVVHFSVDDPVPPTGAIRGLKWNDLNGNGQRERNEPSLPGWTIFLDDNNNGKLDDGEKRTVTGNVGQFALEDLEAGTYVVAEVQQDGWRQTYPGRFAELLRADSHPLEPGAALEFGIHGVELVPSPDDTTVAGAEDAVRIDLGVVWPSTAHHLLQDATAVTVEDGRIVIDVYSRVEEVGLQVITTEQTSVVVPGIGAGHYGIVATLHESAGPMLPAFAPTWRAVGVMAVRTNDRHVIALDAGQVVHGVAFGNRRIDARPPVALLRPIEPIATAGGEATEFVVHYFDPDGDVDASTLDDADIVVLTPMQTELPVQFVGLETADSTQPDLAAVYRVAAPGGTWDHEDNGPYVVLMQPEQVADLAGNFVDPGPLGAFEVHVEDPTAAGITGQKWYDRDGDGDWDDAEPPLPGWTIYLDTNGNGRFDPATPDGPGEPATETDGEGRYAFVALEPGIYTVGEVFRPGWYQTFPGPVAELIDPVSDPLAPGNALEFGISSVDAIPRAGGVIGAEITLDVLWPNGGFQLLPQFTSVRVVGDRIEIDVIGSATGEPGIDVLVPESTTVLVPRLSPGTFTIVATLYEAVLSEDGVPMVAATWRATAGMDLRSTGKHVVTVESGGVAEGVDFGNRRGPWVVRRHVFYNNSAFDGRDGGADSADDRAIAGDKEPLLPGQRASWANYTNFSKGINGIMIDVEGLFDPSAIGPENFQFRAGRGGDPNSWPAAPDPSQIVVRRGAGEGGSDRIVVTWPDGTICQEWLQVTLEADDTTLLEADDVFYFGNAIGESGNSGDNAMVTAADVLELRQHRHGFHSRASVDHRFDVNRDGYINALDTVLVRDHMTSPLGALTLITAPEASDGQSAADEAEPAPTVAAVDPTAPATVLEPRAEAEKGPSRPGPIASDDAAGSVDHVPAYSQNRPALKNPYAERYQKRLKDVRVEASSGPLDESLADALFGSPDTF